MRSETIRYRRVGRPRPGCPSRRGSRPSCAQRDGFRAVRVGNAEFAEQRDEDTDGVDFGMVCEGHLRRRIGQEGVEEQNDQSARMCQLLVKWEWRRGVRDGRRGGCLGKQATL